MGTWLRQVFFEDFIINIRKYEHWIKTAFFDDSIYFVRRNGHWVNRDSLYFFNNIKKYAHQMKTLLFEDIIINARSYDAEWRWFPLGFTNDIKRYESWIKKISYLFFGIASRYLNDVLIKHPTWFEVRIYRDTNDGLILRLTWVLSNNIWRY